MADRPGAGSAASEGAVVTPEEVFEQLRDIHMPPVDAPSVGGLDPRPMAVFAGIVAVLWLSRRWARNRAKKARLVTDAASSPSDQRDQIVRAMRKGAKRKALPSVPRATFKEPSNVTEADVRDLHAWAIRRLR